MSHEPERSETWNTNIIQSDYQGLKQKLKLDQNNLHQELKHWCISPPKNEAICSILVSILGEAIALKFLWVHRIRRSTSLASRVWQKVGEPFDLWCDRNMGWQDARSRALPGLMVEYCFFLLKRLLIFHKPSPAQKTLYLSCTNYLPVNGRFVFGFRLPPTCTDQSAMQRPWHSSLGRWRWPPMALGRQRWWQPRSTGRTYTWKSSFQGASKASLLRLGLQKRGNVLLKILISWWIIVYTF